MTRYPLFPRLLLALILTAGLGVAQAGGEVSRPRLVVGIVVDQMRWDYLYRYYDRYGDGGFKRLLREGYSAENAAIDYLPTLTAVGHSSIYTGSVPAVHGITGNDFLIEASGQSVYCTEDPSVRGVGEDSPAGRMSPRNLLASTITDELKLATNFRAKVIGIALKDRGAILPAGHFADAAYWYSDSGQWISSTFYMRELPAWLQAFNARRPYEPYLQQGWAPLYPLDSYVQSDPGSAHEGPYRGRAGTAFPIDTAGLLATEGPGVIRRTPYGNSLTLELARTAIAAEKLGQNPAGVPDFLALSLSATDSVGHQFSPNSVKVEDTYLRLDRELAGLLSALDRAPGKGRYLVFLSADHGAAHNPGFFIEHRGAAGFFDAKATLQTLDEDLRTRFGTDGLIRSLDNYQVHLDYSRIASAHLDEAAVIARIVQRLQRVDGIAFVTPTASAASASIPAALRERIVNGYHLKRSGAIQYGLEPQWYGDGHGRTGTSHGAWNPYDSHIPVLFMGWGIRPGAGLRPVRMSDIAPTLAALLRIQQPNGSIGTPIADAIDPAR